MIQFLFLSQENVYECSPSMKEGIELARLSLGEHGRKEVENPPKPGVHPLPDAFIHAMPAWLKQKNMCGLKWVSGFPSNIPKGLPTIVGTMVLNSTETGLPLAFMDGTYITGIRTAAVTGVAMDNLAIKGAETIAIVGCGVQGKLSLMSALLVRPGLKRVQYTDVWEPSIAGFTTALKEFAPQLEAVVCKTPEEALTGADIIVCATGKLLSPIFDTKWIKPGALVLPVHVGGWNRTVLNDFDRLYCDDWAQFVKFTEDLYDLPEAPHATLGEVVAGLKKGRENDTDRIIDFNLGLAIHDIVFGMNIYETAKTKGVGQELLLSAKPLPLPKMF